MRPLRPELRRPLGAFHTQTVSDGATEQRHPRHAARLGDFPGDAACGQGAEGGGGVRGQGKGGRRETQAHVWTSGCLRARGDAGPHAALRPGTPSSEHRPGRSDGTRRKDCKTLDWSRAEDKRLRVSGKGCSSRGCHGVVEGLQQGEAAGVAERAEATASRGKWGVIQAEPGTCPGRRRDVLFQRP